MAMRPQRACGVVLLTAVALAGFGQSGPASPVASPKATGEGRSGGAAVSDCAGLSEHNPQLEPVARLCKFAQTYRRSLPNFICDQEAISEQETASNAAWPGGPRPTRIQAQVTYADGGQQYSKVRINDRAQPASALQRLEFSSSGEFGSELIELFSPPIKAEFRFEKRTRVNGADALEFTFDLPQKANRSWTLIDETHTILPEFAGTLYLDAKSERLLRMDVKPMHLPRDFLIVSADTQTDYGEVKLGEAGVHLLPVRAESHGCLRHTRTDVQERCFRNVLRFHGCHRFTAKARIVDVPE